MYQSFTVGCEKRIFKVQKKIPVRVCTFFKFICLCLTVDKFIYANLLKYYCGDTNW